MPILFGVRHLSPGGARQLIELLDQCNPDLILIEGPSDLNDLMKDICHPSVQLPIAMMAYSETLPVRSILYPFAEYSPEYQAILWANQAEKPCRFIDLPSGVFLAFSERRQQERENALESGELEEDVGRPMAEVYERIAQLGGEQDQETYWERHFEHHLASGAYQAGAAEYGRQLRENTVQSKLEFAENLLREGFMKHQIADAISEGYAEDRIVVVTGAYHLTGLETCEPLTDSEIKSLPSLPRKYTLMPYSYYRLTSMSGYGAGNKAPAYYEMIWNAKSHNDPEYPAYSYLTKLAAYQRQHGGITSSAEVIEAIRLSKMLAQMRGGTITLQDLHDAATTCMGHGNFSEIASAAAAIEVGTRIGRLPEGISQTSVQEDFNRLLKDLKLEKYRTLQAESLELDLRENTRVKSEKSAFLDLNRSFFLHRLNLLGIHFAEYQQVRQDKATWAEHWVLRWTPEAEIEIIETALKGDTIELAAAFHFQEQLKQSGSIAATAEILNQACLCGMPETVSRATGVLQGLAIDAASVEELAKTAEHISSVIRYGTIRRLDPKPLIPILQQLFLRSCLILAGACSANNTAVSAVIQAMDQLNRIALNHEEVDQNRWIQLLQEISDRDDLNTKASGFAAAILLESGKMDSTLLSAEMQRRLSKGIPADLGAGWFEGLSMKNHYTLIARLSLWKNLSEYIDSLDDEEFKRALVFLRRAFSEFSAQERNDIAENLGEIWGYHAIQVSEMLNETLSQPEQELLEGLDDFDFGDL